MVAYKILSLDDGGTWAPLLHGMALEEVFGGHTRGHDVLKQFHLVAASGGGAITLAELILDRSPAAIAANWGSKAKWRKEIFAPTKWWRRILR